MQRMLSHQARKPKQATHPVDGSIQQRVRALPLGGRRLQLRAGARRPAGQLLGGCRAEGVTGRQQHLTSATTNPQPSGLQPLICAACWGQAQQTSMQCLSRRPIA